MAGANFDFMNFLGSMVNAYSNYQGTAPFSDIKTKPPMGGAVQNPYTDWGRIASALSSGIAPQSNVMRQTGIQLPTAKGSGKQVPSNMNSLLFPQQQKSGGNAIQDILSIISLIAML